MSMNKKQIFFKFFNDLMEAAPEVAKTMPEDAKIYMDALLEENTDKPMFTENGKLVLQYLKDHPELKLAKSKTIAEGLGISSRTVSGSMRKLVNDGFVEKVGQDPVIYSITNKGIEIEII